MLRLLCFTAHPDDEAGGFGGTLHHYAERGVETHVVCMTPGQAATHRGGAKSDNELARMRRREFAAACKLLKVNGFKVAGKTLADMAVVLQQFRSIYGADLSRWQLATKTRRD